ncbi:MAG: hypothetical protein P1Q69_18200 [Candidatus Thorarchaeota archaeon]|nr:hypothetical protein [Candidatus Thorarchaeota archaeon]
MKRETRLTVSTFGAIVGMAGLEHGVGEILQGNIPTDGLVIESWPNIEAYEILAGEPAMTIIPNFLLSGIVTVIVSIIFILWAVKYVERRKGGLILIIISLLLLLIGGGFGPPIMGSIIGGFGMRMNNRSELPSGKTRLGSLWPVMYVAGMVGYFSLWPGLIVVSMFFPIEPMFTVSLTLFSFSSLILALLSSSSYS